MSHWCFMNKTREQRGKRRRLRLEAAEVKTIDEHSRLYFDDYLHRNINKLRSEQKHEQVTTRNYSKG